MAAISGYSTADHRSDGVLPTTVHPTKATIAVVSALSATRRKKSKVSVLDKSRR
jgi:hypothetical protein